MRFVAFAYRFSLELSRIKVATIKEIDGWSLNWEKMKKNEEHIINET
jgi:hypothetical protein